jgi:hypothetical protein
MQVVKQIVIVLILLPLAVMFFMPKKELYYLLEKKLHEQHIMISGELLHEGMLSLTVEHPVLSFSGASLATAKSITLWSVLFYTNADFEELLIAEGLPTELSIKKLTATHSVLSPMSIAIAGESSLGALQGQVNLGARTVHLDVPKGGSNKAVSKYLKKSKKGWYYESKF